jgi:hypothetical protein
MAGSFTNTFEDEILNVIRGTTRTGWANRFIGLFTVAPSESAAGTEVAGGSYARQAVVLGAPGGGVISNTGLISFPAPSAGWGLVVGWGLFEAVSGGTCLVYGDQTPNKTIDIGDVVEYAIGDIDVSLD